MGILFIGIGLLVGILAWVGRLETSSKRENYQERRHFEQEQIEQEQKDLECRAIALYGMVN